MYIVVVPEYDFWESNTLKYVSITFLQSKHKYVLSSDILWADQCFKTMIHTLMTITTETFIQFHFQSLVT